MKAKEKLSVERPNTRGIQSSNRGNRIQSRGAS